MQISHEYQTYYCIQQSIDGGKNFQTIGFKELSEDEALLKMARIHPQFEDEKFRIVKVEVETKVSVAHS